MASPKAAPNGRFPSTSTPLRHLVTFSDSTITSRFPLVTVGAVNITAPGVIVACLVAGLATIGVTVCEQVDHQVERDQDGGYWPHRVGGRRRGTVAQGERRPQEELFSDVRVRRPR